MGASTDKSIGKQKKLRKNQKKRKTKTGIIHIWTTAESEIGGPLGN